MQILKLLVIKRTIILFTFSQSKINYGCFNLFYLFKKKDKIVFILIFTRTKAFFCKLKIKLVKKLINF